MLILRKATTHDLDFLIQADLSSDGCESPATDMTDVERRDHQKKIAAFVEDEVCNGAWVIEDRTANRPVGMILCRFRTRPLSDREEYTGDTVYHQLPDAVFPSDGRFCEIFQLWVDPAYRRRGLATQLKMQLEAESRRRGLGMIYTHTEEQNLHVIEMNRKLGYIEVRRGPIWDETPRVSLIKHLTEPCEIHEIRG
jgi:ribosomal protein S18 acetylase RimI-like enzyme